MMLRWFFGLVALASVGALPAGALDVPGDCKVIDTEDKFDVTCPELHVVVFNLPRDMTDEAWKELEAPFLAEQPPDARIRRLSGGSISVSAPNYSAQQSVSRINGQPRLVRMTYRGNPPDTRPKGSSAWLTGLMARSKVSQAMPKNMVSASQREEEEDQKVMRVGGRTPRLEVQIQGKLKTVRRYGGGKVLSTTVFVNGSMVRSEIDRNGDGLVDWLLTEDASGSSVEMDDAYQGWTSRRRTFWADDSDCHERIEQREAAGSEWKTISEGPIDCIQYQ